MFRRFGTLAHRLRWLLLALLVVLTTAGFGYGLNVTKELEPTGLVVVGSEAEKVDRMIRDRFGQASADVVAALRNEQATFDEPTFQSALDQLVTALRQEPSVREVTHPRPGSQPPRVSEDGHTVLMTVTLEGTETEKEEAFEDVSKVLHSTRLEADVGGETALAVAAKQTAQSDLLRAEAVALPILAVLLVAFFRSLVSALLPLVLGAFAIAVSTGTLRLLGHAMDVSVFAVNIVTFLGLGLAIDYSLFVVQRYREELSRNGGDVPSAVRTTVTTAGRTIAFSAAAVAIGLSGLLWFPIPMLRSIGIGGILIVVVTLFAGLILLPALLSIAGRHVNSLAILPRGEQVFQHERGWWYQLPMRVMRHPIAFVLPAVAVLLVAGSPFLRMETAAADARIFPPTSEVRKVHQTLHAVEPFDPREFSPHRLVVETDAPVLRDSTLEQLYDYAQRIEQQPGVTRVDSILTGSPERSKEEVIGALTSLERQPTSFQQRVEAAIADHSTLLAVESRYYPNSREAAAQTHRIRELAPEDFTVRIGGIAARLAEVRSTMGARLGPALTTVLVAMSVALLVAFGSVPVVLKAIVVNALSLTASFGALVWVFQDGRLEGLLGYESAGAIDPTIPVLMFAIVFGLSMDYEVFLLSRIREAYDRTRDNRRSVAIGLSATGRIITSAALMLIVIMGAIAAGDLVFLKALGIGMSVAIAVDATIVRGLLVPATMVLLGRWNWWAPRPLARWWKRVHAGS